MFMYRELIAMVGERHFGKEIIANRAGLSVDDPKVGTLWLKLYKVQYCPFQLSQFYPHSSIHRNLLKQ